MYTAVVLVVSQIPVVGPVLGSLLVPAATLGLMAATAEAAQGRFPMPSVLISAFRAGKQQARAMLVLGALYTAGSLLAGLLGNLLVDAPPPAPPTPNAPPQLDARMLMVLALHSPLAMLFWHAPALVHWHGVPPLKSLFFSGVACIRNFGAMLIYGLAWLGLFLVVGLVLSVFGAVARTVLMPTVLLMAAMFTTSMYFTFRDSFLETLPQDPAEPAQGDSP